MTNDKKVAELFVTFSRTPLKDPHGRPYRMLLGDPGDFREMTAYGVVLDALNIDPPRPGESQETGEALAAAKYRKGKLSDRIIESDGDKAVGLSCEEAALIKKLVVASFITGIAYPILKLFEASDVKPAT